MRIKPKHEWHNFDYEDDCRLGETRGFLAWKPALLSKFLKFAQERLNNDTGIRFKINAFVSRDKVGEWTRVQLVSDDPYVYPNVSKHTSRFDSPYNRLETYVSMDVAQDIPEGTVVDVAVSINQKVLERIFPLLQTVSNEGKGVTFWIEGEGSREKVKKYCGEYLSYQIFSRVNPFKNFKAALPVTNGYEFYLPEEG